MLYGAAGGSFVCLVNPAKKYYERCADERVKKLINYILVVSISSVFVTNLSVSVPKDALAPGKTTIELGNWRLSATSVLFS